MPAIRPSADLRNNYNQISEFCHANSEPVFITKNGKGDLAVLAIELYEQLTGKLELYNLLNEGLLDVRNNKTTDFAEAMNDLKVKLNSEV